MNEQKSTLTLLQLLSEPESNVLNMGAIISILDGLLCDPPPLTFAKSPTLSLSISTGSSLLWYNPGFSFLGNLGAVNSYQTAVALNSEVYYSLIKKLDDAFRQLM